MVFTIRKSLLSTFALMLCSIPAFANHIGPLISDEAATVLLGVLALLVLCTISAFIIAAGNMRKKDRGLRRWSFILGLPLLLIGLIAIPFLPVVGLVLIALEMPVWIMIFKSIPNNVIEE